MNKHQIHDGITGRAIRKEYSADGALVSVANSTPKDEAETPTDKNSPNVTPTPEGKEKNRSLDEIENEVNHGLNVILANGELWRDRHPESCKILKGWISDRK